jgi:hypothetical protein
MEIKVEGRNTQPFISDPEANRVDVASCKVKKGPEGNDSLDSGSGGASASEAGTGARDKKSVAELHDFFTQTRDENESHLFLEINRTK